MRDRTARVGVLLVVLAVLGLRGAALLSLFEPQFDYEFHALGTLAVDLHAGTAKLGPVEFVRTYTYNHPSSLLTQVVHAILAVPLGPTSLAQRLTSVLAEALCLGLLAWLLGRRFGIAAAVALLPWLLPGGFALDWLLALYGNHTEFVWVGVALFGLALAAPLDRRLRSWWPAGLAAVGAVMAYPPLLAAVAAALVTLLVRRREGGGSFGPALLAAGAVLGAGLLLVGLLLPDWLPRGPEARGLLEPAFWSKAWSWMVPGTGLPLPPWIEPGVLHALGLLGAVVAAVVPGPARAPAVFALAWWAGAFALAAGVPFPVDRYFLPAYFASLLCLSVLAVAPRGWWRLPGLLLCFALASTTWPVQEQRIQPDRWAQTQHFDTLGMTRRLGVTCASLTELPYYGDLLRSGRASPFVGLVPPERDPDRNCGHLDGDLSPEQRATLDRLGELTAAEREAALRHAGAGGWVSHGRSLVVLERHLRELGFDAASQALILEGARREASLSSPFGEPRAPKVGAQPTPVPTLRPTGRRPPATEPLRADWGRDPAWSKQAFEPMLAGHDALRVAAAALVPLVAELETPPQELIDAVQQLASQLRTHHAVEEHLLYPWVEQRFDVELGPLSGEHRALEAAFAGIDAILGEGRPAPGALRDAAVALDADLRAHLRREEDLFVPILLSLPGPEWVELGPEWTAKRRELAGP